MVFGSGGAAAVGDGGGAAVVGKLVRLWLMSVSMGSGVTETGLVPQGASIHSVSVSFSHA